MMYRIHAALVVTYSLLLLFSSVVQAGEPGESSQPADDLEHYVVWDYDEPSKAVFVPEAELQADRRLDQPLNRELEYAILHTPSPEIKDLAEYKRVAFATPSKYCAVASGTSTSHTTRTNSSTLADYIRERNFLVEGKVLEVVTGWFGHEVQTMIYAEVTDILWCQIFDDARPVSIGDVVSISVRKGVLAVDGKFLCNGTDADLEIPSEGDNVLLLGYPSRGYRFYLGLGTVHRLADGMVLPQPYENLRTRTPVSYATLKSDLGLAATPTSRCVP